MLIDIPALQSVLSVSPKLTAIKIRADGIKEGLNVDDEMYVYEDGMAGKLQLNYGGSAPSQGHVGYQPKVPYDPEARSLEAHGGALQRVLDFMESNLRIRMHEGKFNEGDLRGAHSNSKQESVTTMTLPT